MAYLTRFEDYYKSSSEDESDHESDRYGGQRYGPPPPIKEISVEEQLVLSDSEDEGVDAGMVNDPGDGDWSPEDRDWVPQSLVDLKLRIKAGSRTFPRTIGASPKEEEDDEGDSSRVFSNDYDEVCKYQCRVCGLEVDTDRLRAHMVASHPEQEDDGENQRQYYDRKTWHRCGLCGKEILFTRVKLRYHVVSDHELNIQDYNSKFMVMKPRKNRKTSGNKSEHSRKIEEEFGKSDQDNLGDVYLDNITEDDISNDYADLVKIYCKVCTKQVEQDNFRFLHLKKHGMDLADYRGRYGEPDVVKLNYHRCHICEQIFLFTRSRLGGHLSRHKISVKDYGRKFLTKVKGERRTVSMIVKQNDIDKDCMFSNDYEDECSTICRICTRSLNYGNLGSHLYQSHGTKMRDYVDKFGEAEITRKSYHECAICHETLLFIRYHITLHVKTKHGLSINAYNKSHMQLHNVEYSDSNLTDKGRKIGTQKAPQWCDGTMYKCPYCFNVYYRYFTFRIHLINSHKMTDTEERSACVKENEILTDVYRCKICRIQVKRDRMDIEAHLKQAHKTTLKVYSANFESGLEGRESLADTIVRLVREGLMEEPSDRMFRTPKKVKKPASRSRGGSGGGGERLVEEAWDRVSPPSEEREAGGRVVAVKTEPIPFVSVEDDRIGGGLSCKVEAEEEVINDSESKKRKRGSPSSQSSPDSTTSPTAAKLPRTDSSPTSMSSPSPTTSPSPVASKVVISSPQAALHPFPLTPRSPNTTYLPPRAAKLAHSLVSVPQTQEVVKKEEVVVKKEPGTGDILYRCPLESCSWTCGKEGMRQGPAVLHLLRMHNIQPKEMRIRGIKFEKIPV